MTTKNEIKPETAANNTNTVTGECSVDRSVRAFIFMKPENIDIKNPDANLATGNTETNPEELAKARKQYRFSRIWDQSERSKPFDKTGKRKKSHAIAS